MMTSNNMVPEAFDQRGFFTVIFAFALAAAEVISYLILIIFMGLACFLFYETSGSLGWLRPDFYASLIYAGLALVAATGCRWLRRRINRTN
jgi:membrane protein implicated in regulation of membrane protease activity